MQRDASIGRAPGRSSQSTRLVLAASAGAVLMVGAFTVWFLGFDPLWAIATALAVGSVGTALAIVGIDDLAVWEPSPRETPRSTRLSVALIERSLGACDRLTRPSLVRRLQRLAISERDDRQSRLTVVRQVRALIVAELRASGIDPAHGADDRVAALLGPEAITILESHDGDGVTATVIARCLDAIERLTPTPPR